tara:strand:- start:219 stop:536 length:318 start_codon:yes stop_codon:yes gene_type:complete
MFSTKIKSIAIKVALVFIALTVLPASLSAQEDREPVSGPEVFIWNQDPGGEEPDWRTKEGIKNLKGFLEFAEHGCNGGLMDLKQCALDLGLPLDSWPWIVLKGKE